MPDAMRYTIAQRSTYRPPPCSACASTRVDVKWTDDSTLSDEGTYYVVSGLRCRACGTVVPG